MRSWGETGLREGQTWQLADSKMWRSRVILFGVVLCFLQYAFLQTAAQKEGFLSIDCGNLTSYTDPTTSIVWQPDVNLTGGEIGVVNLTIFGATPNPPLQTLRYFKGNQSKSCYSLPVTPGLPCLVRATFLYGNYDGINSPPVFDLSLDATLWTTVNITDSITPLYFENIFTPSVSEVSVCLIRRTPDDVPFISSLELRTMADDSYPLSAGNHLHILKRVNFGMKTIRYNKDPFDRIWEVGVAAFPALQNTNSSAAVNLTDYDKHNGDHIPKSVLMEAITASNISFSLPVSETPVFSTLFFAELSNRDSNVFRRMAVDVDGTPIQYVTLTPINSNESLVLETLTFNVTDTENLITYTLWKNSTLDPLLNALEVYSIIPARKPADKGLVSALNQLKNESNISDWVGDPCLPVPWRELGCNVDVVPPTVVSLDLSGRNSSGSIPEAIRNLTSLRTLLLNSSGFTGSVPDFSSLVSLEYLNLSNNQLSGDFPSWLEGLQNLKQLNIANNNITGILPPCLVNKLGSNFTHDGNIGLTNSLPDSCGAPGPANEPSSSGGGPGPASEPSSSGGGSNVGIIAGAVVAAVVVVLVIAGLFICLSLHSVSDYLGPFPKNDIDPHPPGVAGSPLVRQMSEEEIREATNGYQNQIAEGVFYGKLSKGNQEVAVKVLSDFSQQETQDFTSEVTELAQLNQKHLVALLGFSVQGNGKQSKLVYEYMEGRDLHQRLHGPFTDHSLRLTWKERINIALDTAVGLQYLHSRELLHLDLKCSSILLNRKNTAKIANYRLRTAGDVEKFLEVKGTPGYVDPDSVVTDVWTTKSDVYSFGVLQLELLCGRPPFSVCPPFNAWLHIVDWVNQTWQGGEPEEIVDAALDHVYNKLALRKYLELSLRCTDSEASNRPLMTEVVHELEIIIQMDMENRAG